MKHLFSTRVRVVLLIAILLAVVLAVVGSLTGVGLPNMLVKGFLSPIRGGASKVSGQAEDIYDYMFSYEALAAENEALKEQVAKMESDIVDPQVQMFLFIAGQQYGPYDYNTLKQFITTGQLTAQTLVWQQGMTAWTAAGEVKELQALFAPTPPSMPPIPGGMPPMPPTL